MMSFLIMRENQYMISKQNRGNKKKDNSTMMTVSEFRNAVSKQMVYHPELRYGQAVFNCMLEVESPSVHEMDIRGVEGLDPFYNDNNVELFIQRACDQGVLFPDYCK